jgi:hypothetical protein
MLVYAIAVGAFLVAAVVLMLLMYRALTAEDARYGAPAAPPAPQPPAPSPPRELDHAA